MKNEITIVLADDHPMFRSGVRHAIELDPSLKVLREASDGEEALRYVQEYSPRVAALDISMPKMTGVAVAKEIQRLELPVAVVLLTMHDDEELFNAAMEHGVLGYVLKDCAPMDIVQAIHAAAERKYYISPKLSGPMRKRQEHDRKLYTDIPGLAELTDSERTLMKLIASGKSSKQIADELCVSPRTVDNRRYQIAKKLNIQGSFSLLKFATEHKSHW